MSHRRKRKTTVKDNSKISSTNSETEEDNSIDYMDDHYKRACTDTVDAIWNEDSRPILLSLLIAITGGLLAAFVLYGFFNPDP